MNIRKDSLRLVRYFKPNSGGWKFFRLLGRLCDLFPVVKARATYWWVVFPFAQEFPCHVFHSSPMTGR